MKNRKLFRRAGWKELVQRHGRNERRSADREERAIEKRVRRDGSAEADDGYRAWIEARDAGELPSPWVRARPGHRVRGTEDEG